MKYNQRNLALKISKENSITYCCAYNMIKTVFNTIENVLAEDGDSGVIIANVISLKTYKRAERKGINPSDGLPMIIKSRGAIKCVTADKLATKIRNKYEQ